MATAASGLEEEVQRGVHIPVGRGFAGRIAAQGRPVVLDEVDHTKVINPILLDKGIRSLMGAPLLAEGKVIGVLHVGTLSPRAFTSDDVDLLQLAADRAAVAVQALTAQGDRAATSVLQRSLVPSALAGGRRLEMAARYVLGTGNVGGDWYDVFPLPTGEVCAVIGDVAGTGLPAAVIMGRIRSVMQAYALQTADPAELLDRLDWVRCGTSNPMQWRPCCVRWSARPWTSYAYLLRRAPAVPIIARPGEPATLADVAPDPQSSACTGTGTDAASAPWRAATARQQQQVRRRAGRATGRA